MPQVDDFFVKASLISEGDKLPVSPKLEGMEFAHALVIGCCDLTLND